jgi:aspartyl-tRNA(Asn)/glutamyl-tRNA(Gln) amidotransferase subunit A
MIDADRQRWSERLMRGSDAPGWSSALSATEAAKALRDGAYLPSEYVRDVLATAVSRNPEHRGFVEIYADQALRDAGVSDRRLARGAGRLLEGVAFAVKDVIDVKGHRTRGASQSTADDPVASADAEVVTRLRDNGAVLVGKLALEELGIGPTVEDSGAQRPVNPWNPDSSTGGSSSGCAVAVATGLVPIAIGTDTAGSIRLPAAHCGIVGFKPSYDAVSRRGMVSLSPTLDHIGIATRNARDAELVLRSVCADARERDAIGSGTSLDAAHIGVVDFARRKSAIVDAEVSDAVADVVSVLRAHGAHVDQATLASLDTYQECGSTILHVEAFEQHQHRLRSSGHLLHPCTYRRLSSGSRMRTEDYTRARALQRALTEDFDRILNDFDALVAVTTLRPPGPAFDADTSDDTSSTLSPRMPFNVVGAPAIAMPISLSANGLPLSMQLVGARGADYQLLALAHACEQALDGRVQRLTARRS